MENHLNKNLAMATVATFEAKEILCEISEQKEKLERISKKMKTTDNLLDRGNELIEKIKLHSKGYMNIVLAITASIGCITLVYYKYINKI